MGPMMRETFNTMSGGMIARIPREGVGDVNLSPLERFLRLPIVSNTLGRRIRISNKGWMEGLKQEATPAERMRAKVRTEAWKDAFEWGKTGTLPADAALRQAKGAWVMTRKPHTMEDGAYLATLPAPESSDAYYVQRLHDYMLQVQLLKTTPKQQALQTAPWTQRIEVLKGYGQ
jgi:hypothetical protein